MTSIVTDAVTEAVTRTRRPVACNVACNVMLFTLSLCPLGAAAQTATGAATPQAVDSARVTVAPTKRLVGDARSLFVVSVERPTAFDRKQPVRYGVVSGGTMPLLGTPEGVLAGDEDRVLFTISVPGAARAGTSTVATVQFTSSAGARVDVPVEFEVRARRQLTLTQMTELVSLMQGGRTLMRVRVDNGGNATDTVRLAAILPERWIAKVVEGEHLILAPRQSIERSIDIRAPSGGGTGAIGLTWTLRGLTSDSATTPALRVRQETMLEVVGEQDRQLAGPAVGLSVAAVSMPGQPMATVLGAQMTGPISEHVRIDARWMQQASAGTPGLARVGGLTAPGFVAFTAPTWRLDLGNAGMALSDISGLNAQGRGASVHAQRGLWTLDAIGAQTTLVEEIKVPQGRLGAARLTHSGKDMTLMATASHLRNGREESGRLEALSLGVARNFSDAVNARAEVAARRFATGSGVGASAEVNRRNNSSEWRLRAARAPGGADAFALATTDVTATGSQRLGAMRVGTLAWYADDAGVRGRFQRNRGVSLMPQWQVGRQGSIGGEVRRTEAVGGDSLSAYETAVSGMSAFAAGLIGRLNVSTSANVNRNLRVATLSGTATPFSSRETQVIWTTQAALSTRLGVIDLYSGLQRAFGERVLFNGQHEWQVRMENIALPGTGQFLRGGASVGSVQALDGSSRYVTTRFNLSAILPFDAVVRLDRERNPLFAGVSGRSGWTTVMRVERSFGAPAFLANLRSGGVVFEDTNDNGRRDAGERGIPGVVVRSAGEVSVTDGAGVYRLARRQVGAVQLDERSLPFGLMIAPKQELLGSNVQSRALRDIAVQPVSVIEILLTLSDEPYAAGKPPSLEPVTVVAIDRDGRRFLARNEPRGLRVFDALPPGEYRIEVDASEASEPLTPRAGLPTIVAQSTRTPRRLTIQLGPRRLRMFRGSAVIDTLRSSHAQGTR